jgi:hypothetical protein
VRICYYTTWAKDLEPVSAYLERQPTMDLRPLVNDPADAELMGKARLDCDWYAQNARAFAAMQHAQIEFLPAWVCGKAAVLDVAKRAREPNEERWLIMMAHLPQTLAPIAGKVFELMARTGVRHLFYAYDEASRYMPCFREIAPHLRVLIHDESPLDPAGAQALRSDCLRIHRSWVANIVPFSAPFVEEPEAKIVFLGSQIGLTEHRRRQIDFLRERFKDRFAAFHDHSVSIAQQHELGRRFKVSVCPEGRKFSTPAMAASHTDRPFWSGCAGMVPVSEDSSAGGRLEELHRAGLIVRYAHGDLKSLAEACERALALPAAERRRIYEHFNRHETIGAVVAEAIAKAG